MIRRLCLMVVLASLLGAPAQAQTPSGSSPWQPLTHQPSFTASTMLLLTDGTVIVQDNGSISEGAPNWWRLTPDINGSYVNGSWSRIASLPAGYAPRAYASAVLPDGRVIIEGGEFNGTTLKKIRRGEYKPRGIQNAIVALMLVIHR